MQPIEAAYLSRKFHLLFSRKERREINKKAAKALTRLANAESRIKSSGTPSELKAQLMALSHERVECPLLMQGRCLLYLHRPVTCRIYGIPTSIEGKGATCGRSGFVQGERYPTISMEIIDNRLYEISRALMADIAGLNLSHGELLFSVAAALSQLLDQEYFIKLKNPCS
jgi:Fe-S-cluster containining protein